MVKLTKIYTKIGDQGQTQLTGGNTIAKTSSCIQLIGSIDELNSHLGVACSLLPNDSTLKPLNSLLLCRQQELFNLGADISIPNNIKHKDMPHITTANISALEADMDKWLTALPNLASFILPGGHPCAAALHVTRGVCRRAERDYWLYQDHTTDNTDINGCYLNRLSDWLFVLARRVNQLLSITDTLWQP